MTDAQGPHGVVPGLYAAASARLAPAERGHLPVLAKEEIARALEDVGVVWTPDVAGGVVKKDWVLMQPGAIFFSDPLKPYPNRGRPGSMYVVCQDDSVFRVGSRYNAEGRKEVGRRHGFELQEHIRWYCPRGCGTFYARTSTVSRRAHERDCTFVPSQS